MAGEHQILAYATDGQIIYCPTMGMAVPSSDVTTSILDAGGTELETDTADLGALSTTLDADAPANTRILPVADETGCSIGDPIVIVDDYGRYEQHIVEGITTGEIVIRDRLGRDYDSGASVESALITYTLDLSVTATWPVDTYYQAVFSCADWTAPRAILFRIMDLAVTSSPIRYEDIRRWIPHASAIRDGYDEPGLDEAREAAWDLLSARIESQGRDPATWRGSERLRSVGGLLAAGIFALAHGHESLADRLCGDPLGEGGIFASHWESTTKTLGWFDEDQDRAVDKGEVRTLSSTWVRRGL